ncbi:MAG TPA: hypothetical protein VEQ42_00035 [Pyrinomonadaceae bacterium]|nr:hypothetical protein [Pyrinomonadaceae bacterium]
MPTRPSVPSGVAVEEIVSRLRCELEPTLRDAAKRAAASEHERTREWLETRGLPKAARVAQREAFNVLRQHGLVNAARARACAGESAELGLAACEAARTLTPDEVRELAEACVAMLETHGRPIEATLAEMSTEAGGWLLAADAPRVRELAESLADRSIEGGNAESSRVEKKKSGC